MLKQWAFKWLNSGNVRLNSGNVSQSELLKYVWNYWGTYVNVNPCERESLIGEGSQRNEVEILLICGDCQEALVGTAQESESLGRLP